MLSQRQYPHVVFSPRPTVVSRPIDPMTSHRSATVKQSKFSYMVSSDGIEICHPSAIGNGDSIGQVIANGKGYPLFSKIQDPAIEEIAVNVEKLTLHSNVRHLINIPLVSGNSSLGRRRGKCPANLDLHTKGLDEDSWIARVPWVNEAQCSARSGQTLADSNRPPNFPSIGAGYELIREIGNDSEGVCTLVKRRIDSELHVIKTVGCPKLVNGKPVEARIIQDLLSEHHKNIIQLYSYESMEQLNLVQYHFEYCSGGDLHDLIVRYDDHNSRFPETFIWKVFCQLLSALEYLHRGFDQRTNNGIVHRDVKPENIFVRRSQYSLEYPDVVLADFGSASLEFATYEPAGTFYWQPPEIPRKAPKGDVWAVGAIIHYMIHLIPPMLPLPRGIEPSEHNQDSWELRPDSRQPIRTVPGIYSQELTVLMLMALEKEECKRMNARWLLRAVEDAMDQTPPPGAGSFMNAEPLEVWAFDEGSPNRGDDVSKRCLRSDDGYRQYIEMMGETY